jgi:hypothetical protein
LLVNGAVLPAGITHQGEPLSPLAWCLIRLDAGFFRKLGNQRRFLADELVEVV